MIDSLNNYIFQEKANVNFPPENICTFRVISKRKICKVRFFDMFNNSNVNKRIAIF